MQVILAVALGGATGAVARYALSSSVTNTTGFGGAGTFVVNVLGAFLLGLLIGLAEERLSLSDTLRTGLAVGVLGGFTTFSSYMWDTVEHAEAGNWPQATMLLAGTIVAGVVAMIAGLAAGRA